MSTIVTLSPSTNGSPAGKSEHSAPATGVPPDVGGGVVPVSGLLTGDGEVEAADPGTVDGVAEGDVEPNRSPNPVPPATATPAATPAIKATSRPPTTSDSFKPLDELPRPIRG
jgi:hypothetical protein